MAEVLTIMGKTTVGGAATEVTLTNAPAIAEILEAIALITNTNGVATQTSKALTVVTDTPDADGEIQRTAVNKFKLYLTTALKEADLLILNILGLGERVKP